MGNKNRRAPQTTVTEVVPKELSKIVAHPGLSLAGNILTIKIDYCASIPEPEKLESVRNLLSILPNYATYTQIIQLSIQSGIPHQEDPSVYQSHIKDMKAIVNEVNKWEKLQQVRVRTLIDYYNFPQIKLAAAMFGLRKGVKWNLTYVEKGYMPVLVQQGEGFMARLVGVWKREFC